MSRWKFTDEIDAELRDLIEAERARRGRLRRAIGTGNTIDEAEQLDRVERLLGSAKPPRLGDGRSRLDGRL